MKSTESNQKTILSMLTIQRALTNLLQIVPEREVLQAVWDVEPNALPYWGA